MYQDLFFHGVSAGKYKFDETTNHTGRKRITIVRSLWIFQADQKQYRLWIVLFAVWIRFCYNY